MSSSSQSSPRRYATLLLKKWKKMGPIGSPFSYLLFVVFQLLQQHCLAVAGNILVSPVTQYAPLNTGVGVFFCRAIGSNSKWFINGNSMESGNHVENGLIFTEVVTLDPTGGYDHDHNMTVSIPTNLVMNYTQVQCSAYRDEPAFSDPAYLIIMGGPSAPEPDIRVINSSLLVLEWEEPFSWPEYPIDHYTLEVNVDPLNSKIIPKTQTSVLLPRTGELRECRELGFSVRANNGLADSDIGTVQGGFPIAPQVFSDAITEAITFYEDLTPLIRLEIKLPRVCSYQDIEYTVTLMRMGIDGGVLVSTTTPQRLQYSDGLSVIVTFTDSLVSGAMYNVTALFWTFAERDISISEPVQSSKVFRVEVRLPDQQEVSNTLTTDNYVIIGVIGGAVLLLVIVLLAIMTMACVRLQRRSHSQRPDPQNRPLPMVTNPIYEGAVYETLDLRLNSLAGNTFERPKTPTTPTSSTAPLILESPYAITNLAPSYAEINPQSKVDQFSTSELDNSYTVMTPAGVANKGIPAEPMESNLDQDVRYAREPVSVSIPVTVSDW